MITRTLQEVFFAVGISVAALHYVPKFLNISRFSVSEKYAIGLAGVAVADYLVKGDWKTPAVALVGAYTVALGTEKFDPPKSSSSTHEGVVFYVQLEDPRGAAKGADSLQKDEEGFGTGDRAD